MVQYKIISVPIIGTEREENELNAFLRTNKIVHVEKQFIAEGRSSFWTFCISYIAQSTSQLQTVSSKKEKVDYKNVLDESSFLRFTKYREIRKKLAKDEAVPAYAIFTDEELAELAKIETLSKTAMLRINGIGDKKVEKYAPYFIDAVITNET